MTSTVSRTARRPKLDPMARSMVDPVHYSEELQSDAHALLEENFQAHTVGEPELNSDRLKLWASKIKGSKQWP